MLFVSTGSFSSKSYLLLYHQLLMVEDDCESGDDHNDNDDY